MLQQELKKLWYPPFILPAVISIVILCTLGECYENSDGGSGTVLDVITGRDALLLHSMDWFHIWESGLNTWSYLFIPVLLSMSYIITLSEEGKSGNLRLILIRSGALRYGWVKVISGAVTGGGILVMGYGLYGILMLGIFPLRLTDASGVQMSAGGLVSCVVMRLLGIFLYGAMVNLFALFVSVFFRDPYMLLCLPVMMKYIYTQVLQRIETGAMEQENMLVLEQAGRFRLENMIQMSFDKSWWLLVTAMLALYGLLGFGYGFWIRERRDSGAW